MQTSETSPTFDARDLNLKIDREELKALYAVRPSRVMGAYIFEWIVIVATIALADHYFHWWTYIPAVILIGSRMHALAIVMHDAAHFRFLRNRKLSDLITDVLACFPMLINVEGYRRNHTQHHQHLNTRDDPDWTAKADRPAFARPQTRWQFLGRLALYLIGYQGIADARWMARRIGKDKKTGSQKRQMQLFYMLLFVALSVLGLWKQYLLFWIVPFFTSFMMFQYIRSFAEHFGDLEYGKLLKSTRTVKPFLIERVLIAPYNISYHLEHHLYPAVPFYNLPALHHLLMADPGFSEQAHMTRGYFYGLLKEL